MSFNRTWIATGGTLAGLGVLAAVALGAGGGEPSPTTSATSPAPEVRTETIQRTARVPPKAPAQGRTAAPAATAGSSRAATAPAAASSSRDDGQIGRAHV